MFFPTLISEEEHEINLLMTSLSKDKVDKVLQRVRTNKNTGKDAFSVFNEIDDILLRRIIVGISVDKGTVNLNDIFFSVYALHLKWWESKGAEIDY